MSGFQNITGFGLPTSVAGFLDTLQDASFRGVPFLVVGSRIKVGRRLANHQQPYVDGGWPEDMGRAQRTYSFSGHVIGDLAPAMQLALTTVLEIPGSGILVHPSVGAVTVAVQTASTAVHMDNGRLITLELEFIEDSGSVFPASIIATAISVLLLATSVLSAVNTDLSNAAGPAAVDGPAVTGEGAAVVGGFAGAVALTGQDPTAIVGMAANLPPPDSNTTYGRYAAGSAVATLPIGTTVASLQAGLANQRAALAVAGAGAVATAASYSAATDMLDPLAAILEAMRAGITDPAAQVRVLTTLAGFAWTDNAGGLLGIGAAMGVMRDAMAAACRRAALVSLARASAAYQPVSYNDAAALRLALSALFEIEITAAGDTGEDNTYTAMKQLRAAVVRDLTTRGANLPSVVTVTTAVPMPSLALAQSLYGDASRADQLAAESDAIHPAFLPVSFQALSR